MNALCDSSPSIEALIVGVSEDNQNRAHHSADYRTRIAETSSGESRVQHAIGHRSVQRDSLQKSTLLTPLDFGPAATNCAEITKSRVARCMVAPNPLLEKDAESTSNEDVIKCDVFRHYPVARFYVLDRILGAFHESIVGQSQPSR